jgi:hypothetical protein
VTIDSTGITSRRHVGNRRGERLQLRRRARMNWACSAWILAAGRPSARST